MSFRGNILRHISQGRRGAPILILLGILCFGVDRARAATPTISGELKAWHKLTLTIDGPEANETDSSPNPFTDYRMTVEFQHESGSPRYLVPGYFAADGNAAETSATSGNKWRAHLSPDKPGKWTYVVRFVQGEQAAVDDRAKVAPVAAADGVKGSLQVAPSDKTGRDFRNHGRLTYVGKRYLQFAGSEEYFLKAGADAPETFLAYQDFDNTIANKPNVPLKSWQPHVQDWHAGDPTWKSGKGKGMIGAINYLAGKGCNVISFLPYNAGGDGDNVWPFVTRNDQRHYDCSKLDQWQVVFDHAQTKGVFLHFKLQEQEMDDKVPTSLNKGDLGPERKLYCRELVARFGHELALNWNLGEENTQSAKQQRDMAQYLKDVDPYDHPIVAHTFPNQQDQVYSKLIGDQSVLTGASLQNEWNQAHARTLKWVTESAKSGRPWVCANDEQGPAEYGVPADPGYAGQNGKASEHGKTYDLHDIRKRTLWGTFLAGGAGVEYYFGYKTPQNDLLCEDLRSRDRSWDYCKIALDFFRQYDIPFWEMNNMDELLAPTSGDSLGYCFAKPGTLYLVYLGNGGEATLDLTNDPKAYRVAWFNPRTGDELQAGTVADVKGGKSVALGAPPQDPEQDWLVLLRK
ncbi:DUF5060 domain-containing protein [Blastopirellula marina]|uniref:DUF5060 domain-containing protein n=1 Tax=Blastopirellula marina TaxID=124 RepID=A0A2S8FA42_9BACT|nr:DUF5060 domain-containing protein [Blastopirellula marina]PQO29021.1 hypothetical protein C5Y98_22695 [Blastopirellula marina]PTL42293.1 DUF5060 domain-containing protein [Blastopirellula marina]